MSLIVQAYIMNILCFVFMVYLKTCIQYLCALGSAILCKLRAYLAINVCIEHPTLPVRLLVWVMCSILIRVLA